MKVLFLGGAFDETIEKGVLEESKGTVHYAANKLQWNFIDGLLEIDNVELEVLSAPFIGSYPKDYRSIRFVGKKSFYKDSIRSNYVSFNNIWGYRNISRKNSLIRQIKNFAMETHENKCIVVYSPHTPFLQAAVYAKRTDPSIHICLIVPDLPQFMNLNEKRSFVYDVFKKLDISLFEKNSNFVDSFVLLTESMKKMLKTGTRPFVVVEGVVNKENENQSSKKYELNNFNDIMTVVYTGTLNKKFGVVNLVEAFHKLSMKNVCLKLCGRGDSEDIIKEYASIDNRIEFLGQLSNKEAVSLQKNATVLVNPRQNNEEFTKYSFPSKNMEYLLTGIPVIAYKLDGIPDEYDEYFYYVEDNSIVTLTRTLEKILSMSETERVEYGSKARDFVLREKNNYKSSKKIIDMIRESRGVNDVQK